MSASPPSLPSSPNVRQLLASGGLPTLEGRLLLGQVLGVSRTWLIAHDTDAVAPVPAAAFLGLAARRRAGEPIAYLLGEREFMGHRFEVGPDVLIPRPETELLVETALVVMSGLATPRVLDLGTGSGAIAVSLALARPDAQITATDASAGALAVARRNAARLGARLSIAQGDWFEALEADASTAQFDLIVSNPPYVANNDHHLTEGDLRFEPRSALTDHADGLTALRTIAQGAIRHLVRGGQLWMEHGWDQGPAVRVLLAQAGFTHVKTRCDLAGLDRITGGVAAGLAPTSL